MNNDRNDKNVKNDKFERTVYEYIIEHELLVSGDACIVGVSGGADSICLLTVLAKLKEQLGISLHVAHVNHMIRGEEADADERYVESYCQSLKLPCEVFHIDVVRMAEESGLTVEEAGRNARYEAFDKTAEIYHLKQYKVAVAHNKNDVAETVLFHMARGTGIAGLKGIPVKRGRIIRPLLAMERTEIEAYLKNEKIAYCTDSTNLEDAYTRNKVRHNVLGELQKINDKAVAHIGRLANTAAEYDRYVNQQLQAFLKDNASQHVFADDSHGIEIDAVVLQKQDRLIENLAILELIGIVCGGRKDIGEAHVEEVKKLYKAATGSKIMLPGGAVVYNQYGILRFLFAGENNNVTRNSKINGSKMNGNKADDNEVDGSEANNNKNLQISNPGVYPVPGGGSMKIDIFDRPVYLDLTKKEYTKFADYDRIQNNLTIRKYMENDYMVIAADGSSKKLNRLFSSCKIPVTDRPHIPLVASEHEIIWAVGVRFSEKYKVRQDTKKVICFEYIPADKGEK